MIKYEANPAFENCKYFVTHIREIFSRKGKTIYNKRNHVKIITYNGISFCVKSFAKPHWFNRIMYSYFRFSKAKRSFHYALKILNMGVKTPDPVAYVEYYSAHGVIQNSFYISVYQPHDYSLGDVFEFQINDRIGLLSQFARFVCNTLHANGIFHKDLSGGNILIRQKQEDDYEFFVIDLNRIRFCKIISYRKRMQNLKRIQGTSICISTIAHFYCMEFMRDPFKGALRLKLERLFYNYSRQIKKGIKSFFQKKS